MKLATVSWRDKSLQEAMHQATVRACSAWMKLALAALLGLTASDRALAASPSPNPVNLYPHYHEIYQVGTHNSYWVKRDNILEIEASGTQERLLDQLLFEKVRAIEIDVHKDDTTPHNFTVYHTDKQSNAFCSPLVECLKQLQLFHYLVPNHEVVTVLLELKEIVQYNFDASHTPSDLDVILEQYLGTWLYRPAQFLARCPAGSTMRDCAVVAGWPKIRELRGRFLVAVAGTWRDDVILGPAQNYQGHGPAGWVTYATWGGGVRDRSAFPEEAFWIRFNEGPSTDTVDPALVDAARAASVLVNVEQEQIDDPRVVDLVNANLVIRAGTPDQSLASQQHRIERGAQIIATESPWLVYDNRGPRQPFRPLPAASYVPQSQFYEPGSKLLFLLTRHDRTAIADLPAPEISQVSWETFPSTTRPSPNPTWPNPRGERGKGCLRASLASRRAWEGSADSIMVCRHTFDGNSYTHKPLGEDAVITLEVQRNGSTYTKTFYSEARTTVGVGDLLRLIISNAGGGASSCATAYSAASMQGSVPAWVTLGTACFGEPLVHQSLVASEGDVLFAGTRRTVAGVESFVAADDLGPLTELTSVAFPADPGYVLIDQSWPGKLPDTCPRNAAGNCLVAVHRSYRAPQHFYSTNLSEASSVDFDVEAKDYFFLERDAQAGHAALYRCYRAEADRHFLTLSADCEGVGNQEGPLGYLAPTPESGTVPLYRLWSRVHGDHLYTISFPEVLSAQGYVYDGPVGYVWRSPTRPDSEQRLALPPGYFVHNASGKCLDVPGSLNDDGRGLHIWSCHYGDNQKFAQQADGMHTFGNKCMETRYGGFSYGTVIQQNVCNALPEQSFQLRNEVEIRQGAGCMGSSSPYQNFTPITLQSCERQEYRSFTLTSAGEIKSPLGLCVDPGWATAGTAPVMYQCTGGANQQWTYLPSGEIRAWTNLCLTSVFNLTGYGGSIAPSDMQVRPCNGSGRQRWAIAGQIELGPNDRNRCAAPAGPYDGAPIELAACNYSTTTWTFKPKP